MNFPLRIASAVRHKLLFIVRSFEFVCRNFWISSLLHFWHTHGHRILMSLRVSESFPWGFLLLSVHCGQRKYLIWFSFSGNYWGVFCVLSYVLCLNIFPVHVKRMCILCFWDYKFSTYELSPCNAGQCSMPQCHCWDFVWKLYPFLTVMFFYSPL